MPEGLRGLREYRPIPNHGFLNSPFGTGASAPSGGGRFKARLKMAATACGVTASLCTPDWMPGPYTNSCTWVSYGWGVPCTVRAIRDVQSEDGFTRDSRPPRR